MKKRITAIVLAAGQGKRMGTSVQKQFLELKGYPVLYYALDCFERYGLVDEVILVTEAQEISNCRNNIIKKYHFNKVKNIVAGGRERCDSVYEGLKACEDTDYVYIHDGARPFVDAPLLDRIWQALQEYDACTAGVPAKDTIKIADGDGCIAQTPPRELLWNIQTPQAFSYDLIWKAHCAIQGKSKKGITDDAMIVEQQTGCRVKLVEGSYENIKITTPEDLDLAKAILDRRKKL